MYQAFLVVLREGFESFLIVAIMLSYLGRTGKRSLIPAVYWGIAVSVVVSVSLGYFLLTGVDQALWEGVLGIVTVVAIVALVIHMWRIAPHLKRHMEEHLLKASSQRSDRLAFFGVFLFTVFMISREGMETALILLQVRDPQIVSGILLGLAAAFVLAFTWMRLSHLINLKRFFQVTGVFLLLFALQVAVYSFHEFTEAGIFPQSEALHVATEPYTPTGLYGRWFSIGMVLMCVGWLVVAWFVDKRNLTPVK